MWSLEPKFFDEHGALADDLPELSPEDAAAWASASTAFPTLSITGSIKGVALQSVVAAERCGRVHELEEKYASWMLLKVLLAEVHYLLNDTFGAHQRLLVAQDAIGRGKDEHLDRALLEMAKIMEDEGNEEEEAEEGINVACSKRPGRFSSVPCSWSVADVRKVWQVLEQTKTSVEFGRYAAILTNVLEGVFSVDGQSMSRLVKRGFYVDSIEGISATSRIKKKERIVAILKNTEFCLRYLKDAHKDIAYDESMIQGLHKTLMEGDNLNLEKDEEDRVYTSFEPCGVYRRVPCFARHSRHKSETRYCPWRQIPEEMQWYIQEAQLALADDSADPFWVSAWLQWAFLTIHPFADGNDRVSRIISSIPLIKAGLPPVVVSSERKDKYFDTLLLADSSGDLLPLASFLKEEVDLGIIHISSLGDN